MFQQLHLRLLLFQQHHLRLLLCQQHHLMPLLHQQHHPPPQSLFNPVTHHFRHLLMANPVRLQLEESSQAMHQLQHLLKVSQVKYQWEEGSQVRLRLNLHHQLNLLWPQLPNLQLLQHLNQL